MKRILLLLIVLIICISANAQYDLGTKSLYKAPIAKLTAAPEGYQPVFINHVGRHGARHLTKEVNTSFAYATLSKADSAQALTIDGRALFQMVKDLASVEKGKVKSISAEGITELQGIGERMYAHYPNVFGKAINLNVTETKEIRTKQSADAFMTGLKKNFKATPTVKEYIDDTNLRFYDLSPVYTKFETDGEWLKYREAIAKEVKLAAVNEAIVQRIFKPEFAATLTTANKDKFVSDIYGFATITYSLKKEIADAGLKPIAFLPVFKPAELTAMSKLDLVDDYYAKGPGIDPNGIQVKIAAPLLANFIITADDFMKTGNYNAQLRFAHAETISPFATFMGISTASKATKTTKVGAVWQSSTVIPLSANIQWIFYKNATNSYLVKVLLNEKEVRINGLTTKTFPYYKWADMRKFYMKKLQAVGVGLGDDMNAWLQKVK